MKQDEILKQFWKNNNRFADLFNVCVFEGREVVKSDQLEDFDTDVSAVYKDGDQISPIQRARDVIKKDQQGNTYIILGLENQTKVDYSMPLRVLEYDVYTYRNELNRILSESGRKSLRKGEKLHATISIVMYYGEKTWDGPRNLHDLLEIPAGMEKLLPSYPMNFIEIQNERRKFKDPDVQALFTQVQGIRENNLEESRHKIKKEVAYTVAAITNNMEVVDQIMQQDSEDLEMCDFWKKAKITGIEQGIEHGI